MRTFAAFACLFALAAVAQDAPPKRPVTTMAMKPVVCREVADAKGKTGAELAQAIEQLAARMIGSHYHLAGLLPGDPPIACFASLSDPSKLPLGAR